MNDNDILSQFRKPPRPEFAQALHERLSKLEGESMNITNSAVLPHPSRKRSRAVDWRLALVAATVLVIAGVVTLTLSRSSRDNIPSVTSIPLQARPVISADNADQVEHLAELGKGNASAALWSPDGETVVVVGSLGAWVYDASDFTAPLYLIEQRNTYVSALKFSQDGSKFAFSTLEGIVIWDMVNRENIAPEFEDYPASVSAFTFSPDGDLLAVGDYEGRISIYDTGNGALKSRIELFYQYVPIWTLNFNQEGTRLLTSADSPVLVLEDPSGEWSDWDGEPVVYRPGERSELITRAGSFSPDGKTIAARVGNDAMVWDAATGAEIQKIDTTQNLNTTAPVQGGGGGTVKGGDGDITFSPDGQQIATVDETVRVWDLSSGTGRTVIESDNSEFTGLGNIHFSPDWRQLAQVGFDGIVHFIDVATGEELATISDYTMMNLTDLVFSPDAAQLVSGSDTGGLRFWDIHDLSAVPDPLQITESSFSNYGLQRTVYSPDGTVMASYLANGDIQLWDTASGTELVLWDAPDLNMNSIGFGGFIDYNADGSLLASTSPDNSVVWLWDTARGQVIRTLDTQKQMVSTARFSPDGSTLAVGVSTNPMSMIPTSEIKYQIFIYDVATGEVEKTFTASGIDLIRSIAFNPDGSEFVSVDNNGKVLLWDVERGQMERVVQASGGGLVVRYSPDGSLILTLEWNSLSEGGRVNLWDADSGKLIHALQHESGIQALAISDNSSLIAAGAVDGTIHLWGIR